MGNARRGGIAEQSTSSRSAALEAVAAMLGIADEQASGAAVDATADVPAHALLPRGIVHGGAVAAYVAYGGRRLAEELLPMEAGVRLESCKVHHLRPMTAGHATVTARVVIPGDDAIVATAELAAGELVAYGWSSWRRRAGPAGDVLVPAARSRQRLRDVLAIDLVRASEQATTVVQAGAPKEDPERWVSLLTLVDCASLSLTLSAPRRRSSPRSLELCAARRPEAAS